MSQLPERLTRGPDNSVRLVDVLWLDGQDDLVAAFEVEHSTSIYSGIVRMLDVALGSDRAVARNSFLVAPDEREGDVRSQFSRPAFSRVADLDLRYLPYSESRAHRDTISRFGTGLKAILAIARPLRSALLAGGSRQAVQRAEQAD